MANQLVTLERCKEAIMEYWRTGNTELLQEVGCDIRAENEAVEHRLQRTAFPVFPEFTNAIAENTGPARRGIHRRR